MTHQKRTNRGIGKQSLDDDEPDPALCRRLEQNLRDLDRNHQRWISRLIKVQTNQREIAQRITEFENRLGEFTGVSVNPISPRFTLERLIEMGLRAARVPGPAARGAARIVGLAAEVGPDATQITLEITVLFRALEELRSQARELRRAEREVQREIRETRRAWEDSYEAYAAAGCDRPLSTVSFPKPEDL